ncbi:MAG: response regulator transcription factor [Proteobacteria bacterium]|nr:response regulator transcription factor [Pseudomonadota bacterium]
MAAGKQTRIVIADDHPLYREALTAVFDRAGDIETLGAVDSLDAALEAVAAGDVALALLDLDMPGMNGVTGIAKVRERHPDMRVAVISGSLGAGKIREVLAAGACGYLPKTFDPSMILAAVRLMLSGAIYVPPDVLVDGVDGGGGREARPAAGAANLTPRELEVLRMLAKGSPNKEIARAIGVAEVTVKLHTRRILEKLGVRNRAAAAALAVSRGLVGEDQPK